jgi:hypothetical protein
MVSLVRTSFGELGDRMTVDGIECGGTEGDVDSVDVAQVLGDG